MIATAGNQPSAAIVKWAVLGTGAIASTFAEDIRLAANAELVAVCSRTPHAANVFAQRFGGLTIIPDIATLAADRRIDAVYLATPNTAHFAQAHVLLSAGKPVLIEKPLVTTSAQARALSALAAGKKTFAMEALWTVFLPAVDQVRKLLRENAIGAVTNVYAELAYAKAFDGESRFFSPALGGGALLDLGIYPVALTLSLFGTPQSVAGKWSAASTGVDMEADIRLRYPGFSASIVCGFNRNGDNRFVIDGETGSIVIDAPFLRASRVILIRNRLAHSLILSSGPGRLSQIIGNIAARLPLPGMTVHDHNFRGNGLQFEIEAASKAILTGESEQALMPLGASIAAIEIIETVLMQPAS